MEMTTALLILLVEVGERGLGGVIGCWGGLDLCNKMSTTCVLVGDVEELGVPDE